RAHAERAQVHDLLEILHALGNHVHAHVPRQIDQRLDDGGRVTVGADGIHKHLVDFDDVDTKLEHIGKPAVAGADVVDGDAHAQSLQSCNDLTGFREILDRVALGHFQHDLRKLDQRICEDVAYIIDDRRLTEELAGEI